MKAEELVGKWIVEDTVAGALNMPAGTAFKVVGFVLDLNCVIIDAKQWGWSGLDEGDVVVEKCKTYWYVSPEEITKVL